MSTSVLYKFYITDNGIKTNSVLLKNSSVEIFYEWKN